jgi:hypothetical protein
MVALKCYYTLNPSTMIHPDHDCYEIYPIKENLWLKNNIVHKQMRIKSNNCGRWFCVGCFHRCNDPLRVRGTKSLMKTKDIMSKTHKYHRKPVLNYDFINMNNNNDIV